MADVNLSLETPETLNSPFLYDRGGFFASLRRDLREIYRYRSLVRYLVGAGLARERRMVLGVLWWLIDPLAYMFIYVLFIGVILHRGGAGYPAKVLVGVISWKYFTITVNKSMSGLIGKERLMKQVAFPRSVIPISSLLTESVHVLIGICLAVAVAGGVYGFTPTYHVVGVVPVLIIQGIFGLGLGFLLATANVFFRDTQLAMSHVFRIWFYLSPALYETAKGRLHGTALKIYGLNPFATLFPASRQAILYGAWPNWSSLAIVLGVSVAILAIGYSVFVHFEPEFGKVS